MSECGARGKPYQWAFKAKAGKKGFQPQSKPPVHTGGFDYEKTIVLKLG
ncbi:hypothetical protein AJ85_21740 [Alkalihalobacillus alcalophilus ATCC 27647 = CGMCC 1.3604]|uniref:Uncharacterized protein n=1 Tax=Alkalihalobacillus alcalophilus ATCC 27647 = CGMCC 1.3604 TaxID=1218173 RepID=A0A4S4K3Y9_ALKAL|nr:hypothetical protein AJ85_21740 [Alkalihalobacillus alcalophilus ATCC 27647 = CGMCC 1.3604]